MSATAQATLGSGAFSYTVRDWGELPAGWCFGDVGGVAVDARDNVYVFHRGEHPVLVFDRHGALLRSWGEGLFTRPHGIHIDVDGCLWCTDDGDHTVRKCTPEGKVLLTIGVPHLSAPYMSGLPFHRCTHTATSPRGDLYVSDGYGNACVHKFDPAGRLVRSWGRSGIDAGEFNLPHNICCDADGRVYVADRENHRVQVFDGDGRFEAEWPHLHRPCALCMRQQAGAAPLFYVGEVGPALAVNRQAPNLGPRISVLDGSGKILARVGEGGAGEDLNRMIAPHGIAVDSHGDIYLGEVTRAAWPGVFPDRPPPPVLRTFRKFVRAVAPGAG